MKNDKYRALNVLTCAAMSLPGMISQSTSAETVPDKTTLSYRHTQYGEADQPPSIISPTGSPRYEISVHQFLMTGAISDDKAYSVAIGTESMSGASPELIFPDDTAGTGGGRPIQLMSGATIEEERSDINVGVDFYEKTSKFGIGLGHSAENDYSSFSASINHSRWYNNKNTTLDISAGGSFDTIEPTEPDRGFRPTREKKDSLSASIGISHVINKKLLLGVSTSYIVYNGYLSDPYKQVRVANDTLGDSRPDTRKQGALNIQARRYFTKANAALHTDYRLFSTSWGTLSHTMNIACTRTLGVGRSHPGSDITIKALLLFSEIITATNGLTVSIQVITGYLNIKLSAFA